MILFLPVESTMQRPFLDPSYFPCIYTRPYRDTPISHTYHDHLYFPFAGSSSNHPSFSTHQRTPSPPSFFFLLLSTPFFHLLIPLSLDGFFDAGMLLSALKAKEVDEPSVDQRDVIRRNIGRRLKLSEY